MNSQITNHDSRFSRLAWTIAFLAPNVVLIMWLFRAVSPLQYLKTFYSTGSGNDLSLTSRLPLAGLCLAGLFAWACKRFGGTGEVPRKRNAFALGLVAAIFLTLGISIPLLGPGLLLQFLRVAAGAGVIACAAAVGLRLIESPLMRLSPERFRSPVERLVFGAALGLGVLALLVFGLGSAGILGTWIWWAIVAVLLALNFTLLKRLASELQSGAAEFTRTHDPITVAAIGFVMVWLLMNVSLIWTMPVDYDVLEYHLGAPAQYLRDGRVSFLRENAYATLPENGEMLYLLGMTLAGDKLSGLPIAHTILFGAWVMTVAGVYVLSLRVLNPVGQRLPEMQLSPASSIAAAFAAVMFVLIPHGLQLVADFFVEHVQALFHLAAAGAALIFFSERRAGIRETNGWLILSGLLAGLCCGTKTTAMMLTAAPLAVLIACFCWHSASIHFALQSLATFVISTLLPFAPWLLRNGWVSGDPLYPLGVVMKKRTQLAADAPDHIDHLEVNIRAGERSLRALLQTARQLFPSLSRYENWLVEAASGPHLLSFTVPALFAIRNTESAFIVALLLLDMVVWFLFTYRIPRFFYPLCSVWSVVAALAIARLWEIKPLRKGVAAAVVAMIVLLGPLPMMYLSLSRPDWICGLETPADAARRQYHTYGNGDNFEAWRTINALPADSRILCIGDAQTFYLDRTPSYSVVFNESVLETALEKADTARDVAEFLNERGITHIYINYPEWFRLDHSYALTRSPAGKWERATIGDDQLALLKSLLSSKNIGVYGETWPENVFPAYLKLTDDEYHILDEFLDVFTETQWVSPKNNSCEIRKLIKN